VTAVNRFLPTGLLSTRQKYQPLCKILRKITYFKQKGKISLNKKKRLNTISQNFEPKRFDYPLKLLFSNFLWAQIG